MIPTVATAAPNKALAAYFVCLIVASLFIYAFIEWGVEMTRNFQVAEFEGTFGVKFPENGPQDPPSAIDRKIIADLNGVAKLWRDQREQARRLRRDISVMPRDTAEDVYKVVRKQNELAEAETLEVERLTVFTKHCKVALEAGYAQIASAIGC